MNVNGIRRDVLSIAVLGLISACGGKQAQPVTPAGGAGGDDHAAMGDHAADGGGAAPAYDAPVSLSLKFKFHIDDNLPEQDVYIEKQPGKLFRVTKNDKNLKMPLYAAAKAIPHNPFDPKAGGPYPKGRKLGLTLEQWFAAEGDATYTCQDGQGNIKAQFKHLIPNAVYTIWHFFMAMPPTNPFIGTYDLPIGERDGSQSVVKSDAEGNLSFERTFKPCLQLSGEHLAGGLALAWHSDGKTYGVEPGGFGDKTHVQMYVFLPKRAGL